MKDYILFIPPLAVADKKARDWSAKEARIYYDWFISVKDYRIEYLLTVIDETLRFSPEADLKRIGETITLLLFHQPFSERKDNKLIITNMGLALVADFALLISMLIMKKNDKISWKIVKRPKRDISYNLPAMFGFPIIQHIELIGASVANAKAILAGMKTSSVWVEMYRYAIDLIDQ